MRGAYGVLFALLLLTTLAAAQPLPLPELRSLPSVQTRYLPDTTVPDSDGVYAGDRYATSIASDGNWMVVGTPNDGNGGTARGSIDLYRRAASGEWEKTVTINGTSNGQQLGASVAIWDNGAPVPEDTRSLIAVGVPGQTVTGITNAGAVRIYERTTMSGTLTMTIIAAPELHSNAYFGSAVAITSTKLIVGAIGDRHNGVETGAAYVFRRVAPPVNWEFEQKIVAPDGAAGDAFGAAVAINRLHTNRILVGAPRKDVAAITDSGAAYLYQFDSDAGQWVSDGPRIDSPYGWPSDLFGSAVALAGAPGEAQSAYFAIGMPGHNGYVGGAAVYRRPVDDDAIPAPMLLTAPDAQAGDYYGWSVDISAEGAAVLVGAPQDTHGALTDAGSLYTYHLQAGAYTMTGKYMSSAATTGAQFGYSVTTDAYGEYLIGAPYDTHALGSQAGSLTQLRVASIAGFGAGGTATEGGVSYTIPVTLRSRPTAPVELILTPDNQCALSELGSPPNAPGQPYLFSIDVETWSTPRYVTVTAVDDSVNEGTHACMVSVMVISIDPAYSSLMIMPEQIVIIDNDGPGDPENPGGGTPFELIVNPSFEPTAPNGNMKPWKITAPTGDAVKCGGLGDASDCAFRFKGSPTENTTLTYKIKPYTRPMSPGDTFQLRFAINAVSPKTKLVAKLKVKLPGGAGTTISHTFVGTTNGEYQTVTLAPIVFTAVPAQQPTFTITFTNRSKGGKLYIDDVSFIVRNNDLLPRGAVLLPPPAAPEGFRR